MDTTTKLHNVHTVRIRSREGAVSNFLHLLTYRNRTACGIRLETGLDVDDEDYLGREYTEVTCRRCWGTDAFYDLAQRQIREGEV